MTHCLKSRYNNHRAQYWLSYSFANSRYATNQEYHTDLHGIYCSSRSGLTVTLMDPFDMRYAKTFDTEWQYPFSRTD